MSRRPYEIVGFSAEMFPKAAEECGTNFMKGVPVVPKRCVEFNRFPCVQPKVARGFSFTIAHRWPHRKGFRFIKYRKALYPDGHDFMEYRQNWFVPWTKEYQ